VVNADIENRIRSRPAPDDVLASRLRMARVPEGATLIDNPTGGPQGFTIENVYVMAGIPLVMQAMLSTIEFRGGAIVHSRSVTAHLGESEIADELASIQEAYPRIDIGSYPFYRNDIYGTSLVLRSANESALDAALEELCAVITQRGQTPLDIERD
ncbi:MAG: competence/damage-inducible protein A, partial [Pseudomonadota bacterium]|nr:competence/damage-inducible protein A [Pseudomonadota bacterium]